MITNVRDELGGVGVRGRRGRLAGQFIGPFGALINPALDDLYLGFAERPARRHLLAEMGADQAMVEAAAIGVARPDVGLRAAAKRVGTAVQPQAVHLEFGTVTADAVGLEDRLDVALVVDLAGWLPGVDDGSRGEGEERGQKSAHLQILRRNWRFWTLNARTSKE